MNCTRREFVSGLTLAGTEGLFGVRPQAVDAEPPPETTRLRIGDSVANTRRGICTAPQYVAEELLRGEGFSDVQYRTKETFDERLRALATGEADITVTYISSLIVRLDAGDPIVLLAGGHVGCFELFGSERVRAIRDLKGKTVATSGLGHPDHLFLSVILIQVGLDPRRDVRWVTYPPAEAMRLLAEGRIDALLNFPNQAGPAYYRESGRPLCTGAGASRKVPRRQGLHGALRLCPSGAKGRPIGQVAAVRSRGRGAVLRASASRG
jgi:NitT/TauT family transport system substrate-binding protein